MNDLIKAGRRTHVPDDVSTHVPLSIGSFCSIASGLTIVSGQHPGVANRRLVSDFPFAEHGLGDYPVSDMGEGVVIGNDVWIGQGVTLLDRITIGNGCRIGAGAVVTRSVRSYAVMAGNPAVPIDIRFNLTQIHKLEEIAWWRWSDHEIAKALPFMHDVCAFIKEYAG
jgi:acetyltransferase-like isoleucine patch superfamily enzyme